MPGPMWPAGEEEQRDAVYSANRPGWVDQLRSGDIIVGGSSFGTGSSRPAARSLRNLGLGALIAESINGLFFRNAVSFGFVAFECRGIHAAFEEGQTAEISIESWTVRNLESGAVLPISPVPEQLLSLMTSGGIYPLLEKEGLIVPKPAS